MSTLSTTLSSAAVALAATFTMVSGAQAQQAQSQCGNRTAIIEQLTTEYGETLQNVGINNEGAIVEQFANAASGSWTYTISPDGQISCVVAYGQRYLDLSTEIPADDAGRVPQSVGRDQNGIIISTVADENTGEWAVVALLPTGQLAPIVIGSGFIDTQKSPVITAPRP